MTAISKSLDAHHGSLETQLADVLDAAGAADWPGYRRRLAALRAAVLDHFGFEEEELFPQLARTPANEREILVLRGHHDRLRRGFDMLAAAAPQHDPEGCTQELRRLAVLIREHHEHETRLCYPASDRLPEGELLRAGAREIAARARARARAPGPEAIDLRGLQPPEPIVRIFEALERSPREPLRAILPHEPVPLFALLRERGFRYTGATRPDGGYELVIEKDGK